MATATVTAFLISSNRNPTPKINYRIFHFAPVIFSNPFLPPPFSLTRRRFSPLRPSSAVQEIAVEVENKTKLYAVNLPWSLTAADLEKLFGECGTVKDVEIIKQKNGKSRGFAFITMGTEEEAQAAVEKFDSFLKAIPCKVGGGSSITSIFMEDRIDNAIDGSCRSQIYRKLAGIAAC